jgi:pyruvate/2-oxoglutarate dehydrogenase complex dihydrolipoamide acyltransferase (E2) component
MSRQHEQPSIISFGSHYFTIPFARFKRTMGTVSVTAISLLGGGSMSWGIPIGIHPLLIAVGGIAKRSGVIQEQIVIREYVGLTVMFDHDVTDGAPVAHFIGYLRELMEDGYGLEGVPEIEDGNRSPGVRT